MFNTDITGSAPTRYPEYVMLDGSGTAAQPVRIVGCSAGGRLPIINGANATAYTTLDGGSGLNGLYRQFEASGLERQHWSSAEPIRKVFREAFERAGLPYFNPHSLRKTLTRLGERTCKTPEDFKAWSQNLGHEQMLTTFTSYGSVATDRQKTIIRELGAARHTKQTDADDI